MHIRSRSTGRAPQRPRAGLTLATLALAGLAAGTAACNDAAPTAAPSAPPAGDVTSDLVFSPATLRVAPGDTARTLVRVTTGADLRQATFAIPLAPAGLTTRFVPDADGRSGTLLLTAAAPMVAADSGGLMVQGTNGLKRWVGRLALTVSAVPARTLFVDAAAGSNANAGTQAAPFKTLGKALTVATAGDTVRLAKGSYTSTGGAGVSGDVYPLHVPPGVTVRGTLQPGGAHGTFLSPASSAARTAGLMLDGDATVQDLELDVFGTAIQADKGTQTLRNLQFIINEHGVFLRGSARATLINPNMFLANSDGAMAFEQARLTIDGGRFASGGCGLTNHGVIAVGGTALEMKNVKLDTFIGGTVAVVGRATGTLTNVDIVTPDAPCSYGASVNVQDSARVTMTDVRAQGVKGISETFVNVIGSAALQATRLTVANYAFGVAAAQLSTVGITSGTFQGNRLAVLGDEGARLSVSGSAFTDNETALRASLLKVRGSTVLRGAVGVEARSKLVDLGTALDVGANTFLGASQQEVRFAPAQGGQDLQAVGNTWNANTQSAGPDGRYSIGVVSSGTTLGNGQNFQLVRPAGATDPVRIFLK